MRTVLLSLSLVLLCLLKMEVFCKRVSLRHTIQLSVIDSTIPKLGPKVKSYHVLVVLELVCFRPNKACEDCLILFPNKIPQGERAKIISLENARE